MALANGYSSELYMNYYRQQEEEQQPSLTDSLILKMKALSFRTGFYIKVIFLSGKKKKLYLACVNSSFQPNMIKFAL